MKTLKDEKVWEKIGWSPKSPKVHQKQLEILECKARERVICAGRGSGKTAIASYEALRKMLLDNKQVCVVAPSYNLTFRVFDYLEKWIIKGFPSLMAGVSKRPFPAIQTPWGSSLECKSATEPVGILGKRYDLVIVDEASRIPRDVYDTYIFPTTSAGGVSMLISTPFGKNWFYEAWIRAKETKGAFMFSSLDSPYVTQEEWDRAKAALPQDVFAQEYEANFLESAASVFRGVDRVVRDGILRDYNQNNYYVMGVDLAKHNDFSVLTVIDATNNQVVYIDKFSEIDYPFQKQRIVATARRYRARLIVDSTGIGEPICEDLKREGLFVDDFKFTNKSKKELIEKLSIFIEQQHIAIPHNVELIDELGSFGYQMTEKGNITYSAPTGQHDDYVISLALAVWGLAGAPRFQDAIDRELSKFKKKPASFI